MLFMSCQEDKKQEMTTLSGPVFGTGYKAIYNSNEDYTAQFDSLFTVINNSMSTYIPDSDISRVNKNKDVVIDEHFEKVLAASKTIYRRTEGAFDPTIGAVVNAWDFGPEGDIENLDSLKIKSLMTAVGLNKLGIVNGKIKKSEATRIDFNAIAKGYGVDVIADFLEAKHIDHYLVEIGGEIRAKGLNIKKEKPWTVGVTRPRFDGINDATDYVKAVPLSDEAMATSGTYRKFKIDENGNRYSHIIDTKTGYPSKTNLLSISVIAPDCMTADAYATAFKTMGIEKTKTFLESHPELKVFLIFENIDKELETLSLNGFPE